jgi:hypothetical protein
MRPAEAPYWLTARIRRILPLWRTKVMAITECLHATRENETGPTEEPQSDPNHREGL